MSDIYKFKIFADYFQCIVQDESFDDDFGVLWNDETTACMVAVGIAAISIGTLRNVEVAVDIHISDARPALAFDTVDHAVEGAFASPTGQLLVMGCTEYFPDARRLSVASGNYQFLYLISGVSTIKNEWEPADDLYRLYLWPGHPIPTRVIKQWKPDTRR